MLFAWGVVCSTNGHANLSGLLGSTNKEVAVPQAPHACFLIEHLHCKQSTPSKSVFSNQNSAITVFHCSTISIFSPPPNCKQEILRFFHFHWALHCIPRFYAHTEHVCISRKPKPQQVPLTCPSCVDILPIIIKPAIANIHAYLQACLKSIID